MNEEQQDASHRREVHRLLTQGKSDEAQNVLTQIPGETPALRNELHYLHTWHAVVQEAWEQVLQQVRAFPVILDGVDQECLLTNGSLRRRQPICLLLLGEMARALGYRAEASEHIQHGLALLNERRMNIPEVRLLTHVYLGRIALEMNQTTQALVQYETANRLWTEKETNPVFHAAILLGLCETYTRRAQFEQALTTGKQVLRLLQSSASMVCQEHILLLLSRISLSLGENASALVYAQNARCVAS